MNDHILPVERFEWPNKSRLFELLYKHELSNVILLSGDVHFATVSLPPCGMFTPEFTSSGMTHAAGMLPFGHEVTNMLQTKLYGSTLDEIISTLNFGEILVEHDDVTVQIKNEKNEILYKKTFDLNKDL